MGGDFDKLLAQLDEPETTTMPASTITINERELATNGISETQIMQLQHEVAFLQATDADRARKMKAVDRIFRILVATVPGTEDQEYLQDEMADGRLTMRQLLKELLAARTDSEVAAPAKVRRGRPPARR